MGSRAEFLEEADLSYYLSQVGLFRKSGLKSRIQYLRELVESDPDGVSYEGQSAFDVADMVKQYFRDLPEPVFTGKLSESFLHIYQCEQTPGLCHVLTLCSSRLNPTTNSFIVEPTVC